MYLENVRKRSGEIEEFEEDKIRFNIRKALDASNTQYPSNLLYDLLEARYLNNYKKEIISVEEISDFVEEVFMREGLYEAARAYITYRFQRKQFRESANVTNQILESYLNQEDWRVNENSNITYSYPAMQSHISGSIIAHYTLSRIYPKNIADAHISGDFHIHDLSMGTAGYCASWNLRTLLLEGFGGVNGKISSRPPTRMNSAVDQMVNYLGVLQNEWAGAQAFSSFDTFLAPYVRKEKMSLTDIKQCMENFIYGVNVVSRFGQSIFSNISLDFTCPSDLAEQPVIIAGKEQGYLYGDLNQEIELIDKAVLSVLLDGDAKGIPFTFPILTIGVTKDFDYNSEVANLIFQASAKWGTPYFQNYVNSNLSPADVRAFCCRLQLSVEEMRKHTGGLFGGADSTGSVGVVSINLPRIGYLSQNIDELYLRLSNLMELAKDSLEIKRKTILDNMEKGLFPYTKRYLGTLRHHFSTIGLVGMHELCLNFFGKGIETEEGKELAQEILLFMRNKTEEFTKQTGNLYNLEATPAEGSSYRLAKTDRKQFSEIITSGEEVPYYTNSTFLPVNFSDDLFEVLDHQDDLQTIYTGGTTVHLFLGEKITAEGAAILVKKVVNVYGLPYFNLTPTFSICPDHKYLSGEHKTCPTCEKECLIYSRPVGYLRPTRDWGTGKKEEFRLRKTYKV